MCVHVCTCERETWSARIRTSARDRERTTQRERGRGDGRGVWVGGRSKDKAGAEKRQTESSVSTLESKDLLYVDPLLRRHVS